jgi:hypothetical protein
MQVSTLPSRISGESPPNCINRIGRVTMTPACSTNSAKIWYCMGVNLTASPSSMTEFWRRSTYRWSLRYGLSVFRSREGFACFSPTVAQCRTTALNQKAPVEEWRSTGVGIPYTQGPRDATNSVVTCPTVLGPPRFQRDGYPKDARQSRNNPQSCHCNWETDVRSRAYTQRPY